MGKRISGLVVLGAVVALVPLVATPAVAFQGSPQTTLVTAVPSSLTPNVNNGTVLTITQVGARIILGGSFTTVSPPGVTNGKQALTRKYVLAFSAATGQVDTGFVPALDGMVEGLYPGPSADTVYVAGYFATVNGVKSKGITLLSTVTGAIVPTFKPAVINGAVWSAVPSGGHLLIGGTFTKIGSATHDGIGSLNPTTGALDPYVNVQLTGHHNYNGVSGSNAAVGARRMDVNAGGTRLIVVGNFKNANGAVHDQIALVDLGATAGTLDTGWNTAAFSATCSSSAYDTYVRDVAFSPDGSYFIVATTGGGGKGAKNTDGTRALCDSASRWETSGSGSDVQPTWVDWTGNDSFESVTTTGAAVYVGGHQRWVNNSAGQDSPGEGAVPRPGLVALDPVSGIPFSWNPGRNPRGAGAYALLATPQGLYVGSDTTYIGNKKYYRGRIALVPAGWGRGAAVHGDRDAARQRLHGRTGRRAGQQPGQAELRRHDRGSDVDRGHDDRLELGARRVRRRHVALLRRQRRAALSPDVRRDHARGCGAGRPVRRPGLVQRPDRFGADLPGDGPLAVRRRAQGRDRDGLLGRKALVHPERQGRTVLALVQPRVRDRRVGRVEWWRQRQLLVGRRDVPVRRPRSTGRAVRPGPCTPCRSTTARPARPATTW